MMNSMWPRQPLEGVARDMIEAKLLTVDHASAKRAISTLYDTSKWMPSWAEIRELTVPDASPLEAFQKALSVVLIYAPDQRDQNAPDAVRATVHRLGGWRVIGQMKTEGEERKWAEKRWAETWDEVHAEIAAGRPMAELLPAPRLGLVAGLAAGALGKGGE
jgi:hypothetical protein